MKVAITGYFKTWLAWNMEGVWVGWDHTLDGIGVIVSMKKT